MDMLIIAGFLGSGKTTIIMNTIERISERTGQKIAVIVNDFGNIGIDAKVMEKYGLKVHELPRGCICCTLGPTLLETVRTIHDKFKPDLLVVEPSGIADPEAILVTMEHYQGPPLGSIKVVVLLDTVRFPTLIQAMKRPLLGQLRSADIVLMNKADEVNETRLKEVEAYARSTVGDKPVIPVSGTKGQNMDEFVDILVGK